MVPTAGIWIRCGRGFVEREVLSTYSEGRRDEVGNSQTDFVAAWTGCLMCYLWSHFLLKQAIDRHRAQWGSPTESDL